MIAPQQLHYAQSPSPVVLKPYSLHAYKYPVLVPDAFPSQPAPDEPPDANGNTPTYSAQNYVFVDTQPTDKVGALVYAVSSEFAVSTADANFPYPVVGVLTQKISDRRGIVQRYGNVTGIFSGMTTNARGYLGHNGAIIFPPLPDNDIRFSQQVGYATSPTSFFVQLTGQVIQRDVGTNTLRFYVGMGQPQDGSQYTQQDIWLDADSGDSYYQPSAADAPSEVYVGHGPPPSSLSGLTPNDVYYDEDTQSLFTNSDQNADGITQFVLGHGPPPATLNETTYSYYLDENSGQLYAM